MRKIVLVFIAAVFLSVIIAGSSFAKGAEKEVGSTVSQAAHTAKSEGLKGKDLAGKVHEAIDVRKENKDTLKAEEKETKAEEKEEEAAEKLKKAKDAKEKGAKQKHGKMNTQNFGAKNVTVKGNK